MQIELKLRFKFRLILDETWSYGVLGRTGRGLTEAQNVDAREVDMIIGSLSGPLCAAGGFCASTQEVVEHQRISSASYTYSAALPAMLSTTASETIAMLQEQPEIIAALRENVKAMRAQLDPRSEWVRCTSAPDNPILILVLKDEVVASKNLSVDDQNQLLQDVVDEVRSPSLIPSPHPRPSPPLQPPYPACVNSDTHTPPHSASPTTSSSPASARTRSASASTRATRAGSPRPRSSCASRPA